MPIGWSPAKRRQKDLDATWTKKHGKSYYGYKLSVCVDRKHKLIRRLKTDTASTHDSQHFEALLDSGNTCRDVYADRGYASKEREEALQAKGYRPQIQRKAKPHRPLPKRQKARNTRIARVRARVEHVFAAIEAMGGQRGYLTLTRLTIESYEREEHLLFSGFTDDGAALDPETMEKLFQCGGHVAGTATIPDTVSRRLAAESERHAQATLSRSLEQNNRYFHEAREKLERWADDMVLSAEKALADTKEQIKALRRQARQATTLAEQHAIQEKLQKLERQQRRQRQEIFRIEDEIMEKRDQLIDQLEQRLVQRTQAETLFTIRWAVV